jgi:hypothetical protein
MNKNDLSPITDISFVSDSNKVIMDNTIFSGSDVACNNMMVLSEGFFRGQYHFVLTTRSPTWDIKVISMTPLTLFLYVLLLGQHRYFHGIEATGQRRLVTFYDDLWKNCPCPEPSRVPT